ncbi:MAG TPA: FAD-binding domain-containing protein, partial [Polyangiaceae bacterium]|nr:FAD-binding domain-containing protein [Polyangiaceae bacterium]
MSASARVRLANEAPLAPRGQYVLYWMTSARRPAHNFALDHAIRLARELDKPLVVLEALTTSYRWASDRFHAFVVQGMADNRAAFAKSAAFYYPYVEPRAKAGRGLVEALASRAAVVVADDFPCFFLPRLVASVAARIRVRCDAVDSNGIVPLAEVPREFSRAFDFRRFLGKALVGHAQVAPVAEPLKHLRLPTLAELPVDIVTRWPIATDETLTGKASALARLPIDHRVRPGLLPGGRRAGRRALERFCRERLDRYVDERNHPDCHATSELSPYLHFGHISAHEVFAAVLAHDELSAKALEPAPSAQKSPFFQLRPGPAAFLDQLVTWRELGYNFCSRRPDTYDRYEALPEWARRSLAQHQKDAREATYSLEELESARTGDPLWNAAQRELVESGEMHNYMRMLWGKLVIAWCKSPERAYELL